MENIKFIFAVTNVIIVGLVSIAIILDFYLSKKREQRNEKLFNTYNELIKKNNYTHYNICVFCKKRNKSQKRKTKKIPRFLCRKKFF